MAVLEAVEGAFSLFESLLATGLPAPFRHQNPDLPLPNDFRFGWGTNAEHRRFMTEPLPSQYALVDAATHDDLSDRLRGLLINVEDRLPSKTPELIVELIDASEFGIALETMAETLCEYNQPVTSGERADFMQLVRWMAMDDRVERNLALCPDRP